MPQNKFKSKAPVSNTPTGVNIADVLAFAAGKRPGEALNASDIEALVAKSNLRGKDAKAVRKASGDFLGSGNQYMLQDDGNYNVYKDGKASTSAKRSTGNKVGFNPGDVVGLGNNMSKLAGLAKMYQQAFNESKNPPAVKEEKAAGSEPVNNTTVQQKEQQVQQPQTVTKTGGQKKNATVSKTGQSGDRRLNDFNHGKPKFFSPGDVLNGSTGTNPATVETQDERKPLSPEERVQKGLELWNTPVDQKPAGRWGLDAEQFGLEAYAAGDMLKNFGQTGMMTLPLVGGLMKKAPGAAKLANKTMTPLAITGLAGQVIGDAVNPNADVDWSQAGNDAMGILFGAAMNKYLAGRPQPFTGAPVPKGPSTWTQMMEKLNKFKNMKFPQVQKTVKDMLPPGKTPKLLPQKATPAPPKEIGTFGEKVKPKFKVQGEAVPKLRKGGKLYAENGMKINKNLTTPPDELTKQLMGVQTQMPGQTPEKKFNTFSTQALAGLGDRTKATIANAKPVTSTAGRTATPTSNEGGFNSANLSQGADGGGGFGGGGDATALDVAGKVAKYALPFIGSAIANKELGKVKPVQFKPADLMAGVVTDMPKPNMGLRYRTPTGNDLQTEVAGQKFADAQQRDGEANYQIANAQSRIAQHQKITDNINRNLMFNNQGENNARFFNAQQNMNVAFAKSQNKMEPWVAAQHHLATDISTDSYLRSDKEMQAAEFILKTYPPDSPEYKEALRKMGYGQMSGSPVPKGKKGMKFKIAC
jgi:hypothetical protein